MPWKSRGYAALEPQFGAVGVQVVTREQNCSGKGAEYRKSRTTLGWSSQGGLGTGDHGAQGTVCPQGGGAARDGEVSTYWIKQQGERLPWPQHCPRGVGVTPVFWRECALGRKRAEGSGTGEQGCRGCSPFHPPEGRGLALDSQSGTCSLQCRKRRRTAAWAWQHKDLGSLRDDPAFAITSPRGDAWGVLRCHHTRSGEHGKLLLGACCLSKGKTESSMYSGR